jgi:DNA-directed RNA polymerase specialized sigma24 family protein
MSVSSDWPEGLPRNFDELVAQYGDYIAKQVERYNKVDRNFEDLFQEIWVKLMESNLLEKFAQKAQETLPPTMTTVEACAFLGIDFSGWDAIIREARILKEEQDQYTIPVPVEGGWDSRVSVMRTADVVRLDRAGYIRKRSYPRCIEVEEFGDTMTAEEACVFLGVDFKPFWGNLMRAAKRERGIVKGDPKPKRLIPYPIGVIQGDPLSPKSLVLTKDVLALEKAGWPQTCPKVLPRPTARGFKSYLARAIHNHFANFCRTRSRRYKEHVLPPSTIIGQTSSGYCYSGRSETGSAWEGALIEGMISAEEAVAVVEEIRNADVDPLSQQGTEVLDFMTQGYTIKEAIRAQQRSAQRIRLRAQHV